jgi:hypothetical protein
VTLMPWMASADEEFKQELPHAQPETATHTSKYQPVRGGASMDVRPLGGSRAATALTEVAIARGTGD